MSTVFCCCLTICLAAPGRDWTFAALSRNSVEVGPASACAF